MDLIQQYTMPFLCVLGAGVVAVVYLTAAVLFVHLFRMLFTPLRGAC